MMALSTCGTPLRVVPRQVNCFSFSLSYIDVLLDILWGVVLWYLLAKLGCHTVSHLYIQLFSMLRIYWYGRNQLCLDVHLLCCSLTCTILSYKLWVVFCSYHGSSNIQHPQQVFASHLRLTRSVFETLLGVLKQQFYLNLQNELYCAFYCQSDSRHEFLNAMRVWSSVSCSWSYPAICSRRG